MLVFSIIVLALSLGTLGVVLLNVIGWRRVGKAQSTATVSVLIPARNEEANLPECLETVRANQSVHEILVADDHSTDRTGAVVDDCASKDERIRKITPLPLPDGWGGKTHACHSLGQEATADWLLFLDADARLADDAVARMVRECERRNLTFLSCWPELEMRGFFERLLMPLLNFVLLTLFPAPLAARRKNHALGVAHGACIMVRSDVYRDLGGHEPVRSELFEDTRLAQHWRMKGHRSLCLDGTGTVRVRMYHSLGGIWSGFRKNLFPAFRGQVGFWLFMLLHGAVYLLPFALAFMVIDGSIVGVLFACAALAVFVSRFLLALRFGHPLWSALLHPFAELFLLAIGIASWWQVVTGRGVEWKGRRYLNTQGEPV